MESNLSQKPDHVDIPEPEEETLKLPVQQRKQHTSGNGHKESQARQPVRENTNSKYDTDHVDIPELEEETLKLPVQQREQHTSGNGHKESQARRPVRENTNSKYDTDHVDIPELEEETLKLSVQQREQHASGNGHKESQARQPVRDNTNSKYDIYHVDIPELEEETLILPVQQRKRHASRNKHKKSQVLSQPATYDLTVVIPTRNERDNIMPLLHALREALDGIRVEIIFVDDSDDDTPLIIKDASVAMETPMFHVHLEHRQPSIERAGGLATAVEGGISAAQAEYIAVIDADLQHPPTLLREFYDKAVAQDVDLVLATRYIKGGSYKGLDSVGRRLISIGFKWTAKILFPGQLRHVSDPLSGFFLLRRSILVGITLRPIGYTTLLELLIRSPWKRLIEVPYHFRARANGKSKANMRQGILALQHMWRLLTEVPAAGRIWKLSGIVGMNVIVILTLLTLSTYIPGAWSTLRTALFTIIAFINLVLINRFIFPTPLRKAQPAALPATVTIQDQAMQSLPQVNRASLGERMLSRMPLLFVVIAIGWIIYTLPGAWVILAALVIGTSMLTRNYVSGQQTITMILGVAVGLSAIDYMTWRFEVANWAGWWIAVPLLAAETLGALHTLGFQYTLWPKPQPHFRRSVDPTHYPIFIFIPTVNEGAAILEPTLRGTMEARERYLAKYPHGQVTIVVCNDGFVGKASNWQETEELAKKLGVCCITRTVGGGAKAGNLEHARQQLQATGDALIVIFDADQIAKPDFLLKTIPPFADTSVGWVQTGQYYSNLDNPVARWADDQQALFYNLLCPGKAADNAAFICGTNVVIRAKALDQIGGLPQDSVTEDFAASITLHPHWRSLFLTDVLATGLGPMDLLSYLKQQRRWAIGTMGVLQSHWRMIFLPRKNGLSIEQRIQYFLACTHYLCGLRDLIYMLCPILFVLSGTPAVKGSYLEVFFWHFLPYFLSSTAALWYAGRGITGLRGIIVGFGSFPALLESLLTVILQRKVGFTVTSKQRGSAHAWNYLLVYIVLALVCIACIAFATQVKGRQQTSLVISVLWIVYSLCMLGAFLWLSFADTRFQAAYKHPKKVDAAVILSYPSRLLNREQGLRPVWNLGLALCLASLFFMGRGFPMPATQATKFVISQQNVDRPYLGVSLSIELLMERPPLLERELGAHFAIIGRTQVVQDFFDRPWADQLAQRHERPWITLEFGTFNASGKPPLDTSLPAIINGVHDEELKRWAQDIRDYGKPVYLTILLHTDRNWALSSAVANGGIPEDVPRAWVHVQSIFKEVGAINVAWVWAPADLTHDQQYAPPASMIDAVVLFLIRYPDTNWPDPRNVLDNAVARYPTKPIIVEVSADGPAEQKAEWLTKVGAAVVATSGVYALIYHEGSPQIHATLAEDDQWSLASDERSLVAMRQIASSLTQAVH